ncbi:MAG: serine/threonine protein kinase [Thermoleophilaceae bacterium]|nr:serine/threonine protein kinase [Thermoleophilaceae bacterium]
MSVLANGTLIDNRYTVRGRIGSGGMADVYLCDDQHLGRPVALKVMHERFAADQSFVTRFEREAQAAAGLQHKNVVNVFDRGKVGETYYIAMEYLPGRTLKDVVVAMGALDPKLAIHICLQILAAERFAHAKGIVHRDIKPQNVMIDDEWNVKVTDFGIAHNPVDGDLTQTGQMVGTAQYISPEQAQGKAVANTSDLYSTGVVLFEMLTGKVPFDGESSVAIALQHINQPPPRPTAVNAAVPPVLDAVVLKAMAKSPVERFANADEFSQALERARDNLGAPAGKTEMRDAVAATPTAAQNNRRRNWLIAAGIAAALLLAGLAYFFLVGNKAEVPNVVGRAAGDAQSRIAEAGFKSQVFSQVNKAPVGEVISQSPTGGNKAKKGSTVILNVSSGPGEVTMPDVEGLSEAEATKQLEAQGLTVKVEKEFDPDIAKGKCTRTVPGTGEKAQKGSEVQLFVSKGPRQITVPDVLGQDVDAATRELEDAGFEVSTTEVQSAKPENEVTKQSPASGGKADEGSKIKLSVASGQNEVPDVVGLKKSTAIAQLEEAGFEVNSTTTDVTDDADDGNVISQDPTEGTADVGSTVELEIGKFVDDGTTP